MEFVSSSAMNSTTVIMEGLNHTLLQNGTSLEFPLLSELRNTEYPFIRAVDTNKKIKRYSTHHEIQKSLRNVVTPLISILGFLGNIVSIMVLTRLRLLRTYVDRDRGVQLGLIVLAVSDMLFCLSMFPRFLVSESSSNEKNFRWFYQVKLLYSIFNQIISINYW